jgi:hypothetical protein
MACGSSNAQAASVGATAKSSVAVSFLLIHAPIWKIRIGEFAKKLTRGSVVCVRGGYLIREISEKNVFAIDLDLRFPFAVTFIPANATKSGSGFGAFAAVGLILLMQTTANVVTLVIKPVMIYVISLDVWIRNPQ